MAVYLDYNASTPVDERVLNKMIAVYQSSYGNASSRTHQYGSHAKKEVETARQSLGELLGVQKEFIYFTSGSTESNNLAILGMKEYGKTSGRKHILTTSMEHKSVLEPLKVLEKAGFEVEYVNPDLSGRISAKELLAKVRPDTLLVSVMHVNNETGTIQPVQEIGEALKDTEVYFHVDASQSCGKLVEELKKIPYDMLSASAHKMYGPQGVGLLVQKNRSSKPERLRPIMYGGGQEKGLRPGTLPVALIAGFGEAARIAMNEHAAYAAAYKKNRDMILQKLEESGVRYRINGDQDICVDTTLNISFEGYDSEALMLYAQDLAGMSNGSACTSSAGYAPSYVLQAMGFDEQRIREAVRISWGKEPVDEKVMEELLEIVKGWQ